MSSSLDSYSDTGVPGSITTTSKFVGSRVTAPGTRLNDDLLPNRSCSGERGERGADGRWVICEGESLEWTIGNGDDEWDWRAVEATFSVLEWASCCLKIRSDTGIIEPRLEVEDMLKFSPL